MSKPNKFSDVSKDLHMSCSTLREILSIHKVRNMAGLSCHDCIYQAKCAHNFALFYYLQEQSQLTHCKSTMDKLYLSTIEDKNTIIDNQFEIAALKKRIEKLQKEVKSYAERFESEPTEGIPQGSEEGGHASSEA